MKTLRWGWVLTLACFGLAAHGQILIGQTVGVTGAVAATVSETVAGARLYIDSVNAKGGIRGEKIELITLDDKFDVKLAAENARILIEDKKVLALFLNRGTPHTQAILPLLEKYDMALVGPSTGAMLLHQPVNRHVFNVRSSYQREARKAVEHLSTVGITRIAVVHVDDSFGLDGLTGTLEGLSKAKLQPAAVLKYARDKPDLNPIAPALAKADAQAVLWIGSGTVVSDGIKVLRASGSAAQVVTLSNNASDGFIKQLGKAGVGVIITQVLPSERSYAYPFIAEARTLAQAQKNLALSPALLEGFLSAKVMVEALRRASPKPTRQKVISALDSMHKFDLGGLKVNYSPTNHTGLDFADLSIVGSDGKFKR